MATEEEAQDLRRLQDAYTIINAQVDQEAQMGDDHTLDVTVQSYVPVLTFRYINTTIPLTHIEAEMHRLWHTVI
ncbi:hypothetical protein JDV02_004693 [Purpureocillium takamizusanense]|uniref:Uncharacterized protein n=1 Tax=Purpureocillium takamizusanense TaxID=2060973 RepID=A0A9Q8VB38_9HYPO|nr:uncharacterized protein JDV02_004693 [Purpureocillium takamizusanense]UNI18422.1 hypothetical protein JDV02_004693 [Purpureocillium takamizusanense]